MDDFTENPCVSSIAVEPNYIVLNSGGKNFLESANSNDFQEKN
ncbi:hypothetical protein QUA86_30080 [Microcoleus sp. F6_B6]